MATKVKGEEMNVKGKIGNIGIDMHKNSFLDSKGIPLEQYSMLARLDLSCMIDLSLTALNAFLPTILNHNREREQD